VHVLLLTLRCPWMQDMIEAVLEMDDTTVKEVMTALVDVEAIESKATLMELRDLWIQHQYSRSAALNGQQYCSQ
jgi:CBS domain containing-hemolysin-like protein